jgi:hypothetical protein
MQIIRLITSMLVGVAVAFLTWAVVGNDFPPHLKVSEFLGWAFSVLLLPGMIAGIIISGNVHIASPWVMTLCNFLFYFAVTYFLIGILVKRRTKGHVPGHLPN